MLLFQMKLDLHHFISQNLIKNNYQLGNLFWLKQPLSIR